MPARILQPGEIEQLASSQIPFLRLPQRDLFRQRAERLRQLARDHAIGDYLRLIAALADAQQRALDAHPACALPDAAHLQRCHAHGMPPLGALGLQRDPLWQQTLKSIITEVKKYLTSESIPIVASLENASPDLLESMADALIAGQIEHLNLGAAPFLAAALQVHWVHLATQLGSGNFPRIEPAHLCPVCGCRPVASIARIGAQEGGYRYLHCALCAAEWHMVRIKCSHCESTKGITYQHLEQGSQAIKAETCDECQSYLKIVYMEKDPLVEPTADDLATLALDVLVGEMGYLRSGPNLMLLHAPAEG